MACTGTTSPLLRRADLGRVVAQATKFCVVYSNIFSITVAVFSLTYYGNVIISNVLSRNSQVTGLQVTPQRWVLSMELLSPFRHLKF